LENRWLPNREWMRCCLATAWLGWAGCAGPGLPDDGQLGVGEQGGRDGGASSTNTGGSGGESNAGLGTSGGGDTDDGGFGMLPPSDSPIDDGGFQPAPANNTGGGGTNLTGFMIPDFSNFGGDEDAAVPELSEMAPKAEGDLVITELMENPEGGSGYQWIELYNPGATSFNLIGCTLRDKTDEHVISQALFVTGSAYVVMARDAAASEGVAALYTYDDVDFSSSSDQVSLVCGDVTVDTFSYTSALTERGQSIQLSADKLNASANDSDAGMCLGTATIGLGLNKGTPGAANSVCP